MEVQIFQTNPRLRGLLLILIFTFAASGIALAVLAQIQAYHRDQIYLATESALPVHKVSANQIDQKIGREIWKTYRNEQYGVEILFTIEPSHKVNGWTAYDYKKGAVAKIVGKNLKSVEIYQFPTGTGIGEEHPGGILVGKAISLSSQKDAWALQMPEGLGTTNFWIKIELQDGKKIDGLYEEGLDLGNVYDESYG